jgi:hypothetical protein
MTSVTHRNPPSGSDADPMPCCGRLVHEVPDTDGLSLTDDLVDCPGPPTTLTPQETEQMDEETVELAALRERVQAGSNDLGRYAEELVRARKLNLLDLVLTEMRVRLEVLSDAAFGDGSADQFGYELTVQQQCRTRFTEMASAAEQVRGAVEAEQRKAALLKGVTVQARPPGGRT